MKQTRKLNKSVSKKKSWFDPKLWPQNSTEFDQPEIINGGHSVAAINSYLDKKRRKRKSKRTSITLVINDPPYEFPIKK